MDVLEKVQILEKYVSIDTNAIDPVVELTIEKLLKREASRMTEVKQRLVLQKQHFEDQYGLDSVEFCRRFNDGKMGDDMDFVEWAATVDMLSAIENRLKLLRQENAA